MQVFQPTNDEITKALAEIDELERVATTDGQLGPLLAAMREALKFAHGSTLAPWSLSSAGNWIRKPQTDHPVAAVAIVLQRPGDPNCWIGAVPSAREYVAGFGSAEEARRALDEELQRYWP